jgi:predicted Zn-dependent protease
MVAAGQGSIRRGQGFEAALIEPRRKMIAVRKLTLSVAVLCGWAASLSQAAILPTDLEARVGENFEPADEEERVIWQNLARLEEGIRTSPQRLIAPELDAYIRGVVEKLIGRPAPDLRIYLLRDASPNAAMLPAGMMIVNTGLLARVREEAQLAAVLAHEAGHYFRKHSLDLYRVDRLKFARVTSATSALHSYDNSHGAWMLVNDAVMMSASRFSRDLESEADAYGLVLMSRAGYPPRAALTIWEQLIDERRASAAARQKRYRDGTNSELSTHPPTQVRMTNLADTANYLAAARQPQGGAVHGEWAEVIRPYQAALLREQIYLDDPGASLYLLETQAKHGWTALLRFYEGEVYRLRNAKGDALKAASAYATAATLPDAPPEAWRAHGYALLKAGNQAAAREALNRFLAMNPEAADAAMIRFTLAQNVTGPETRVTGARLTVEADSRWKKLHGNVEATRWEDVWTRTGPQVDRMSLIDGLPDGKAIIFQKSSDAQSAPVFRADMSAEDLASMLEVSYRLKGVTVFSIESVEPVSFLGGTGIRLRYQYASGIVIPKRGSCVMRVVDQKLYAMKLEGVANRSFDAVSGEFDLLVAGARLRKPSRTL